MFFIYTHFEAISTKTAAIYENIIRETDSKQYTAIWYNLVRWYIQLEFDQDDDIVHTVAAQKCKENK